MSAALAFTREDFAPDFLFGTATSAYQTEGHAAGNAGKTHWDSFAATPGNVVRNEHGAIACDHFSRYESDIELVRAAGFDCYRFSTSWARVIPEGTGKINSQGLDFYDRLVDTLLQANIKPCVTLYHWELPATLSDLGGWQNQNIADWFAEFTRIMMQCIGDRVFSVAPINEPWCVSWLSHFLGMHAPGLRDVRATARAMHHVLLAHGKSIQVMRSLGIENLGAVCNFEWVEAATTQDADQCAAARYDACYNRFFIEGMTRGQYPAIALEGLEAHLPKGWQQDFDTIKQPLDWFGINYYTRQLIAANDESWPQCEPQPGPLPKTATGWEIYPEGLYFILQRITDNYTGPIPLYVTENGIASHDANIQGSLNDAARIDFINHHVAAMQRAISEGIPVKGYFLWSLLDNYEWALGYNKRFGLVHVDFSSLERTPKHSYKLLQQILSRR